MYDYIQQRDPAHYTSPKIMNNEFPTATQCHLWIIVPLYDLYLRNYEPLQETTLSQGQGYDLRTQSKRPIPGRSGFRTLATGYSVTVSSSSLHVINTLPQYTSHIKTKPADCLHFDAAASQSFTVRKPQNTDKRPAFQTRATKRAENKKQVSNFLHKFFQPPAVLQQHIDRGC